MIKSALVILLLVVIASGVYFYFQGKPQIGVLQAASRSIELTFIVTALLLVTSIFPAFFISKYLTNQIR